MRSVSRSATTAAGPTESGEAVARPRALETIVFGGLPAGVLDIADAFVLSVLAGGSPIRVVQYIASGVIGRSAAFEGGMPTAALGLTLHFFIALVAATLFFAASLKLPVLVRRPLVCGPLFGVAVYFFMNLVVLPLAGFPGLLGRFPPWPTLANGLGIHALGVGLPIALFASRSARVRWSRRGRRAESTVGRTRAG